MKLFLESGNLPKVRDFYGLVIDKQVLWFQISMQVVLLVHIRKPLERLEHDVSDQLFWKELLPLTHELVHVQVEIFEHEVQHVFLEYDLIELNDIWVGKLHQRLNFLLINALIPSIVLLFHTLNRHNFT